MLVKTSELIGPALDWAVTKCELELQIESGVYVKEWVLEENKRGERFSSFSTEWDLGGPIVEREWLDPTPWPNESDSDLRWQCQQHDNIDCLFFGPTLLVAAMRCFVASQLGDEIEIPDVLAN